MFGANSGPDDLENQLQVPNSSQIVLGMEYRGDIKGSESEMSPVQIRRLDEDLAYDSSKENNVVKRHYSIPRSNSNSSGTKLQKDDSGDSL